MAKLTTTTRNRQSSFKNSSILMQRSSMRKQLTFLDTAYFLKVLERDQLIR